MSSVTVTSNSNNFSFKKHKISDKKYTKKSAQVFEGEIQIFGGVA